MEAHGVHRCHLVLLPMSHENRDSGNRHTVLIVLLLPLWCVINCSLSLNQESHIGIHKTLKLVYELVIRTKSQTFRVLDISPFPNTKGVNDRGNHLESDTPMQ